MHIKTKKYKKRSHKITLKNNIEKSLLLNLNLNEKQIICGDSNNNQYHSFEATFKESTQFKTNLIHFLHKSKFNEEKHNFYNYVNNQSVVNIQTPKYINQNDNFRIVQDKVYRQIIDIYKKQIPNNVSQDIINMKNFFESALKLNPIKSSNIYIDKVINDIDNMRKYKSNLWKFLAMINKNSIISTYCPILFIIQPDKKNGNKYCCYVNSFKFLLDLNLFTKDKTLNCNCKQRFILYVNQLFETCFGKTQIDNGKIIFKCLQKIFNCFQGKEFINNENGYNKVFKNDALDKYNFNWNEFTKELSIKETPDFFITSDLNYLKSISTLLSNEWNSEEWRPFWIYTYIRQVARYTQKWKIISTNYYEKFI